MPAWLPAAVVRTLGLLGLGMLIWIGVSTALLQGSGDAMLSLRPLQFRALGVSALLIMALIVQLALQPVPDRQPWRARALAALGVTVAANGALLVLLAVERRSPGVIAIAAAIACIGALGSVSLATLATEAPRTQWHLPAQLALSLLGGAGVFFSLMAWLWPGDMGASGAASSLLLLTGIAAALLLACWLVEGGLLPPARHRLRWVALALLLVAPILLQGWLLFWPSLPRTLWWLTTLALGIALVLEERDRRSGRDATA
ncbi:MAG TPA: hypothetical protein VGC74_13915 [Stenotrophomonas sp.]|jgi:hypothetical protein